MAGDSLNQVGKSIKKIKDTADYASKKVFLNKRIERSRDVFDTSVPFEMEFKTNKETDQVSLDLKFNKPPPRKGCNAECFSNNCQTFSFTDGGDHLINLGIDYIPNTIKVFRDRTLLSSIYYAETDPDAGLVYIQGSGATSEEITVCYVTGDCITPPFDASCYNQSWLVTIEQTGAGEIYLVNPGAMFYDSGQLSPPQSFHLYANTTYTIQYFAFHGPNESWQADSIGGGTALIVMGGPGLSYTKIADQTTFLNGATGYAALFMHYNALFNTPQPDPGGSSVTGRLYYVSGPDPRFVNVPIACGIPESGQTVVNDYPIFIGDNTWRTALTFVLGTLQVTVNGLPVLITETSNQTFIFGIPNPTPADIIIATYVAE